MLLSSQLEPGALRVQELATGALSPVTLVVASPHFLECPWSQFASDLAEHQRVAPGPHRTTLVPALLVDCDLPLPQRARVPLDFRDGDREHWEAEVGRLRQLLTATAPLESRAPAASGPCPYPGMRPFLASEAASFYGRDEEIAKLQGRLRLGVREIYVIGPSGSGKSSLVAAGLIPRISAAPALAGGSFVARQMRPGADPTSALGALLEATQTELASPELRGLAAAADRLFAKAPDERLLLFVDQLEELFTIAKPEARRRFLDALTVLRDDRRIALVLALRADFYGALMESALWSARRGRLSRLDVSPLRDDQLQQVIEAPARAAGVYFEAALLERLRRDAADEPGALPLLQDTLHSLWFQKTRSLLRLADYQAMGSGRESGLGQLVSLRADHALDELTDEQQLLARRVLLRLVQFGDGVTITRRQQPLAALASAGDSLNEVRAVVDHLADRRLLTTGGGDATGTGEGAAYVDLAHEVLLTAWPTLAEWIATRRDDELHRRALEVKAAEWVRSGRGPFRLLDADELRELHGWLAGDTARELGISEDSLALVRQSEAALQAQADAEAARVRELQAQHAEMQRLLVNTYVSQGHALLGRELLAQAAPYLLAARELEERGAMLIELPVRRLFRWAKQGLPAMRLSHRDYVWAAKWSPDGRRIATASHDGTAQIWDAATGVATSPALQHQQRPTSLEWSPDSRRLVTASSDGVARVWDAETGMAAITMQHQKGNTSAVWSPDGRRVVTFSTSGVVQVWDMFQGIATTPPLQHLKRIVAVTWSPDGSQILVKSDDSAAHVWDVSTGEQPFPALQHQKAVAAACWSPDGQHLATASDGGAAQIWVAATGAPASRPMQHSKRISALTWSPDGRRIATASWDGTARIWLTTNAEPTSPPLQHQGSVDAVRWSPDGRYVATASSDGTARVWDATTGAPTTPPLRHPDRVRLMSWGPSGRHLATASDDGTVQIWDVATALLTTPALRHADRLGMLEWSPDGSRIATAGLDSAARIWDVATTARMTAGFLHKKGIAWIEWSPDGRRLATASSDSTARVWDVESSNALTPLLSHQKRVLAAVWSPDGQRVATASEDATARIWNAANGDALTPPLRHETGVVAIAWSPDGRRLVTASEDTTAQTWDARTGEKLLQPMRHFQGLLAVAWSRDGRRIATAAMDGSARIWDADTDDAASPPLQHPQPVLAVAWSPDSQRLATACADGTAWIWNALAGTVVVPPLQHHQHVNAVAWSPDGKRLATASGDRTAQIWDAATGAAVTPPLQHQKEVVTVAWSPDGRLVATASEDGTARAWDAASGMAVSPPLSHAQDVRALAWSPDGTRLATAARDGTSYVWDLAEDSGSLADWRAAVARGNHRLGDRGVLVVRVPDDERPLRPDPAG